MLILFTQPNVYIIRIIGQCVPSVFLIYILFINAMVYIKIK